MSPKACLSITKYFLFVFNLFFFILGSLLFSFGLWILFDRNSFASVLGASYYALKVWSYILSGVGIVTMLMGFLGCLGSVKEIKCMLGFYFIFLLLLFATQITIGILIYTHRGTLNTKVGEYVKGIIETYGSQTPPADQDESWDFVQQQLQCCGWNSSGDWRQNVNIKANASSLLYPCSCRNSSQAAANGTGSPQPAGGDGAFCTVQGVYKKGCMANVQDWLASNLISIVGICLGIALMELFLMTLSMFLCRTMSPDYDKLTRYS